MFIIQLLRLILHTLNMRLDGILIPQVASIQRSKQTLLGDGFHIVVQTVHQWRASGDVQLGDDILTNAIQLLHQRT